MNLILITALYPYGDISETYLEPELGILTDYFDNIYIFPCSSEPSKRKLPKNIILKENLLFEFSKKRSALILFRYFHKLIYIYFWTLFKDFRISYLTKFSLFKSLLIREFYYYSRLKDFIEMEHLDKNNTILYSYWMVGGCCAISLLKKDFGIKSIARAHGWDIYNERWKDRGGVVPFRLFNIHHLDRVCPASIAGTKYIISSIKTKYHQKIKTYHLGVLTPDKYPIKKNKLPIIISCSAVDEIKRVHLIPLILKEIKSDIKWIHIGDGPLMEKLKDNCRGLPDNIIYEIKGNLKNTEVRDFYDNNFVDLFISLTTSEGGAPVSMQEAISYGIPIIACNVGGVPEIVNDTTGLLINIDFDYINTAKDIKEYLNKNINRQKIREFYAKNFNAQTNHKKFIEEMLLS